MRRAHGYGVLLAVALGLTACDSGREKPDAGHSTPTWAIAENALIDHRHMPIATSSWRPGAPAMDALFQGTLHFTRDGCPRFDTDIGVVWPAGYTSIVRPTGKQVIVTADGREIAEGDQVIGGGGETTKAGRGVPCIKPGTWLWLLQGDVRIVRGDAR